MGESGSGTRARHSSSAGAATGTTNETTAGRAAALDSANVATLVGDWVRLDEAAQQLSACVWLTECVEPEPCDSDLCIGHSVPLVQHSMRASGVGCHPAHTAMFPAARARTAVRAARRRMQVTWYLECGTYWAMSNRRAAPQLNPLHGECQPNQRGNCRRF